METESASSERSVKILVLGDFNVGKSTLVATYLDSEDGLEEENPFEEYHVRKKHNGIDVDVTLYDLSPGVTAPQRRSSYPTDINCIILCFSIVESDSLMSVYNLWIPEARAQYGELVPILLVGLKSDARYRASFADLSKKAVERAEGEAVHRKYNLYGDYMECSYFNRSSMLNVITQVFLAAMRN